MKAPRSGATSQSPQASGRRGRAYQALPSCGLCQPMRGRSAFRTCLIAGLRDGLGLVGARVVVGLRDPGTAVGRLRVAYVGVVGQRVGRHA